MKLPLFRASFILFLIFRFSAFDADAQKSNDPSLMGKAELYKAKKAALDYLEDTAIIRKYGNISDAIWEFAELGMQEFKSSALLAVN